MPTTWTEVSAPQYATTIWDGGETLWDGGTSTYVGGTLWDMGNPWSVVATPSPTTWTPVSNP